MLRGEKLTIGGLKYIHGSAISEVKKNLVHVYKTGKVSGNDTRLDSELKQELQGGSRGTEKFWETAFGKGYMSPSLGRVIPDVQKGKGAV